jgi:hypothetical protein
MLIMVIDPDELRRVNALSENELLMELGLNIPRGLGAAEPTDDELEEDAKQALEAMTPAPEKRLCAHPAVVLYIANPHAEVTVDVAGAVADALLHAMMHFPPVTIAVAFSRYCLRRYCGGSHGTTHP